VMSDLRTCVCVCSRHPMAMPNELRSDNMSGASPPTEQMEDARRLSKGIEDKKTGYDGTLKTGGRYDRARRRRRRRRRRTAVEQRAFTPDCWLSVWLVCSWPSERRKDGKGFDRSLPSFLPSLIDFLFSYCLAIWHSAVFDDSSIWAVFPFLASS